MILTWANQIFHIIDVGIWWIFITSILSELMKEELNHMITTPKGSNYFILLDCHHMLLDITGGLLKLTRIILDR